MSVIRLKERLDKMSDSQISEICKRMNIKGGNDKNKKIKSLLLPLISSYSFGDNITVTFTEIEFPKYDVNVDAKGTGNISFDYNVCRDTFTKVLTDIENAKNTDDAFGVFSKIMEHRKEFCRKFSEHINSITNVNSMTKPCRTVATPNRVIKILPNPITCERLK